jgi:hypothetical protein
MENCEENHLNREEGAGAAAEASTDVYVRVKIN